MNTLTDIISAIRSLDRAIMEQAAVWQNGLVKPRGSLGRLETLGIHLAGISKTLHPYYKRKQVIVMAADHGAYEEGIASAPQIVTAIQAMNMLQGNTGVCVLARNAGAEVLPVDMGIDADPIDGLRNCKIRRGSSNFTRGPAMTRDEALQAITCGATLAIEQVKEGVQLLGLGELGMGNTTAAAAIVSVLCQVMPEDVVGRGANLPEAQMPTKIDVVRRAIAINNPDLADGVDVMAKVGGFELAGMAGVIIGGAAAGVPVVLDGFLSYSAALVACKIAPVVHDYLIPSHFSAEKGARIALDQLQLKAFFDMEMRLGEGSGAAMMFPFIDAACAVMNQMGTLADAQIVLPD